MSGLLALVGGREHGPGCAPIDRRVLAAVDRDDPVVAVLPMASSLRTRARAVGRAVGWWEGLGATTVVLGPDGRSARALLDRADVIVMTGGVPDRLHRRLLRTGLGAAVVGRWRAGVHLVGSSSGAMVLADARQSVRPPFDVRTGLGLLPGVAIAPHHELGVPRAVATVRAWTHPHLLILGIDEATGVVGRGGRFEVLGAGGVIARRGTWQRTYRRGDVVELARLGASVVDPVVLRGVPTPGVPPLPVPLPAVRALGSAASVRSSDAPPRGERTASAGGAPWARST